MARNIPTFLVRDDWQETDMWKRMQGSVERRTCMNPLMKGPDTLERKLLDRGALSVSEDVCSCLSPGWTMFVEALADGLVRTTVTMPDWAPLVAGRPVGEDGRARALDLAGAGRRRPAAHAEDAPLWEPALGPALARAAGAALPPGGGGAAGFAGSAASSALPESRIGSCAQEALAQGPAESARAGRPEASGDLLFPRSLGYFRKAFRGLARDGPL
ncbi:unnamed protein product [Prorocentrum cordatum]|uniref:Uncharacterized protein n=1 Tax=Prorocentrum cordatum TaxID=2364126 RepID=A0ABN9XDT2_9DINO|nr:unnamed protein product [Polarella glacialis]